MLVENTARGRLFALWLRFCHFPVSKAASMPRACTMRQLWTSISLIGLFNVSEGDVERARSDWASSYCWRFLCWNGYCRVQCPCAGEGVHQQGYSNLLANLLRGAGGSSKSMVTQRHITLWDVVDAGDRHYQPHGWGNKSGCLRTDSCDGSHYHYNDAYIVEAFFRKRAYSWQYCQHIYGTRRQRLESQSKILWNLPDNTLRCVR